MLQQKSRIVFQCVAFAVHLFKLEDEIVYYVYRFLDESDNIIYVGKSKQSLEQRFRGHGHLPKQCYDLVYKIEFIECPTESDMSIKEIYYINKYHNNKNFFNILDTTELPMSVVFDDEWIMYEGPLDFHFYKSINYTQGYTKKQKIRYNNDGTIDKRKSHVQKGKSTYVEGLTKGEVDLIVEHIINEINNAENNNQEQIRFRNLVMFILGINLPEKFNVFRTIRYKDLLDENNVPKAYALKLDSVYQSEIMYFPLREFAKKLLLAYVDYCDLSYAKNAEDLLFETREHQPLSAAIVGRILKGYAEAVGINKNIGAESIRKTYGLNIYDKTRDKLNALLFLGRIWGRARESHVIQYLNLTDSELDFEYYLGETFSLGYFELKRINCVQRNSICAQNKLTSEPKVETRIEKKENIVHEQEQQAKSKEMTSNKINRLWTADKKLEIVEKNLVQGIPQKVLSVEYDVDKGAISRWISAYKQYGITGLEDKRNKKMNTHKMNFPNEVKIEIVEKYIKKHISADILEKVYHVNKTLIYQWVREYTKYGKEAFLNLGEV